MKNSNLIKNAEGYIVIQSRKGKRPEDWKSIKEILLNGEEYSIIGKYEVSTHGNVKGENGILINVKNHTGYNQITLSLRDKNNIRYRKTVNIHRLVAELFCKKPKKSKKRLVVNHIDSDRTNNYFKNLEWTTFKGNAIHGVISGYMNKGEDSYLSTISNKKALKIIRALSRGKSVKKVSEKFDVSTSLVSGIKNGNSWNNFSEGYNTKNSKREGYVLPDRLKHSICKKLVNKENDTDIIKELSLLNYYNTESSAYTTLINIKKGKLFREISEKYWNDEYVFPKTSQKSKVQLVRQVCELICNGHNDKDIHQLTNKEFSVSMINAIRNKRTYEDIVCEYDFKNIVRDEYVNVGEEWKTIDSFIIGNNTYYPKYEVKVSNHGKLMRKGKIEEIKLDRYKKLSLCIACVNELNVSYRKEVTLHQLVAQTFIENPHNLTYIDALDGNFSNCHVSNLIWKK